MKGLIYKIGLLQFLKCPLIMCMAQMYPVKQNTVLFSIYRSATLGLKIL